MIDVKFPEAKLLEKLGALQAKDREDKILSQKFNGDIIMSWLPDLQGKELGRAITSFKEELGDDYREFILNSDFKTIHQRFMDTYNGEHQ
jgi:hypothetical protein